MIAALKGPLFCDLSVSILLATQCVPPTQSSIHTQIGLTVLLMLLQLPNRRLQFGTRTNRFANCKRRLLNGAHAFLAMILTRIMLLNWMHQCHDASF